MPNVALSSLENQFPPTTATPTRVMIADDDPNIRALLEELLQEEGYTVISTSNGHELVRMAQQVIPDLILIDLMMPQMNGYEAVRQLRNDIRTSHLPMLILTAQFHSRDIVIGFESGADDYITKPFDISALLARIQSHLRRAARRSVNNPLTGLPGNELLIEEIRYRLEQATPFALLYTDLDHFKVFNDTYGFARGDEAILLAGHLVRHAVALHGGPEAFIGHIGGDDFVILTTVTTIDSICQTLIATFDRAIEQLYHPDDYKRGYLSGIDRHGMLRRFSLLSISIGGVTTGRRTFGSAAELTRVAAEMKHYAKTQPGSSYAIDQRVAAPRNTRHEARRQNILLMSDDASLRVALHSVLYEGGYAVQEAHSIRDLAQYLGTAARQPMALLADARLGKPLWAFCRTHTASPSRLPIVVLAATDDEQRQALAAGATACLRQPLPVDDILTQLGQLAGPAKQLGDSSQ